MGEDVLKAGLGVRHTDDARQFASSGIERAELEVELHSFRAATLQHAINEIETS